MKYIAVIHYDEIALKGANRNVFEQALVRNLARKIKHRSLPFSIERTWGRLLVVGTHTAPWQSHDTAALRQLLATTPGVATFGIGIAVAPDIEALKDGVTQVIRHVPDTARTFRITTTRVDKSLPITSQDIDRELGAHALTVFGDTVHVQLADPDVTIRVEVLKETAYVYVKERGLSGLPVGSSGRAVALLSGGFDSPVAAYLCAVRGVEPLLMHFHAYPQTSRAAIEKVEDLARVLSDVCGTLTLALVPLLEAQKEIALTAPEKLRVVLYRRLMMRAAEAWGSAHGARAIITGESVGQVASQTLENIAAVADATALPVLRPLCGMNKQEIIARSRAIGTHDISVLPHDDTCTVFMPTHPETKARMEDILAAEARYRTDELVECMLERAEVHTV